MLFRRNSAADRLFDRPWRPGNRAPARRAGRLRRWSMTLLLLVLALVIGAYNYLTDATRVRGMAESYLSNLTGGRVVVGTAELSVFEGLRLDDVKVYADDGPGPGSTMVPATGPTTAATTAPTVPAGPGSLIFSAQTFVIKYDPTTMLGGKLEARQIVAQKPQVHLTENHDDGTWNYQRLAQLRARRRRPGAGGRKMTLPEVLLRNARVEISEVRGGRLTRLGYLGIDGRLAPTEDDRFYGFELQSRGVSQGMGPFASGSVALATGQVEAQLMNVAFDRDIRSMLVADIRGWWERHALSGRVNIPVISYTPPADGQPAAFAVETMLNGVTMQVPADDLMGSEDVRRYRGARDAVATVGRLYQAAGFRLQGSGFGKNAKEAAPAALTTSPPHPVTPSLPLHRLAALLDRPPVELRNVSGKLRFTRGGAGGDQIDIDVAGRVEGNALRISGRVYGYSPDARAALTIVSSPSENLVIPASPRYVRSMPRPVREVYEQFRPQGECRLEVKVERTRPGARPRVEGYVEVVNGRFVFSRFEYPLRDVNGRIDFRHDETSDDDRLEVHLRGRGPEDGVNRDAVLTIDSFGDHIGPVGTPNCGVQVRITGKNVRSDALLRDAFPDDVRQALKVFDAPGRGEYPIYGGDFVCEIVRAVGPRKPWSFDTDITLADGRARLVAFPYPLSGVAGLLRIRHGYAELVGVSMKRGDATLKVDGIVGWGTGEAGKDDPRRRTDLKLTVRNLPVDEELMAALPPDRRQWVDKIGMRGRLDVDGRIFERPVRSAATAKSKPSSPFEYDLSMSLRDGTLWPAEGTFALSQATATLRLTSDRLVVSKLTGKRGAAEFVGSGSVEWPGGRPKVAMRASVTNLTLDAPLYEILPPAGRKAWDEVQPEGAVDAEIRYAADLKGEAVAAREPAGEPLASADDAAGAAAAAPPRGFSVVLRPRGLVVTLRAVPYRLTDLSGVVAVDADKVTLTDVRGRHRDATVMLSGTGALGPEPVWDLRVGGTNVRVDDELKRALPAALSDLTAAVKLQGAVGFELSKFVYRPGRAAATTVRSARSDPASEPRIDLSGVLNLNGVAMDVGVPLADVNGRVAVDARVQDGHLHWLTGAVAAESMTMAGRTMKQFACELKKPAGESEIQFNDMNGELAGGHMAGRVTVKYPEDRPSRYDMEVMLRDADVRTLASESDTDVKGRLDASLSLEGSWGDGTARRGRGDVVVSGHGMYRVPLVLGLLQVTNLALPLSGPFSEATAAYSLEGQRVTFERIRLSSDTMVMNGTGRLDFADKKVRLSFTTDNPNGLKVPFINELWKGAQHEMLRINVRGSITEPEVSARMMNTLWTTVDEVFKGEPEKPKKKDRRKR